MGSFVAMQCERLTIINFFLHHKLSVNDRNLPQNTNEQKRPISFG